MRYGRRSAARACLLLPALALWAPSGEGQTGYGTLGSKLVFTPDVLAQRISFEDAADLEGLSGKVALSSRRFKDGERSAEWSWSTPEPLVFHNLRGLDEATDEYPGGQPEQLEPSYVPPSRQGGLKLWVYRESPHPDGRLVFQVGAGPESAEQDPAYRFEMAQDFSGWRALWVHFEEDARVAGHTGAAPLDTLRIEPSADMADDRVYLDMLQLVTYVSRKRHSDLQFVNGKDRSRKDHYRILPAWEMLARFGETGFHDRGLEDDYRALEVIEARYERLLLASGERAETSGAEGRSFDEYLSGQAAQANRAWVMLGIRQSAHGVTGMPLFASREEHPSLPAITYAEAGEHILAPLALDYGRRPSDEKKKRLLALFEHMADQGWAAGSALGTVNHLIRLNPYANAVFLLRQELREIGRLGEHQRAIAWYTRFGALAELDTSIGENTDHIRGGAGPKLIGVLLMENSPEKVARMLALRDYIIHVTEFAPGYSDTIKPDFTLFHHLTAYQNAYGVQALTTLAMLDWLLRGTPFALPQQTSERLRDTLMAQFDIAADFELHPALSGRFPYTNTAIDRYMLPGFAFAAMHDGLLIEPRLGAALAWAYQRANLRRVYGSLMPKLKYYGSFGTLEIMASAVRQAEELSWETPSGHFVFPYGAAANHKRPGWAASVRGWSRYIWDWESGHRGENPYGRFMAFGSLLLFTKGSPLGLEASGIDLDGGFHWAYAPGATTKALPMEHVLYEIEPTAHYPEGKHRNFSAEAFAGGVSHRGWDGFYAMKFRDTVPSEGKPLFDDSFRATKSFFFVDDRIIALGSGIASSDAAYPTITTLFQSTTANGAPRVGASFIDGDRREEYDGGVFADPQGNFYVVPAGQTVVFEQSEQTSLVSSWSAENDSAGNRLRHLPVSARHAKAWLDHGPGPDGGAYEYQVLVQGDLEIAKGFAETPGYRVHRRDDRAHVIEHPGKGLTAYALFAPQAGLPGAVHSVDTPLLLIAGGKEGELRLSLADPDLRLGVWPGNMSRMPDSIKNQPAGSHIAEVRLAGRWTLKEPHPDVVSVAGNEGRTTLRIRLDHGLTRELEFVQGP